MTAAHGVADLPGQVPLGVEVHGGGDVAGEKRFARAGVDEPELHRDEA
jgi:hypothetical protein